MAGLSPEYLLAVNVDGVGLRGSATSISFYACPQKLENQLMEYVKRTPGFERIEPWPMGDHMIFVAAEIPTIALTACNIFSLIDTLIHTSEDNLKNIDLDILVNVVDFLMKCIDAGV